MTTMNEVPVIDAERLGESRSLRALDGACREWGFFQMVNHGITQSTIDALQSEMRGFFAQPAEVKGRVARSSETPWGFFDQELTKNTRDWKEVFDCGPPLDPTMEDRWPVATPRLRPALTAFTNACEGLAFRLLSAISINLGMPPGYLARGFVPSHTSFLRLNYYPLLFDAPTWPSDAGSAPKEELGVNQHTDAGALTLLLQDEQPGLEVSRAGGWHLIEPRADALVVNIGDIVQVWSNDRYRAALHRVRASENRARFSAPYFFNPAYETTYAPTPSTVDKHTPPHYHRIRWGEFRSLRAAGDYRDCGEEVQIDHYRTNEGS